MAVTIALEQEIIKSKSIIKNSDAMVGWHEDTGCHGNIYGGYKKNFESNR